MKICITGATGFVGRHVLELFSQGYPNAAYLITGREGDANYPNFQDIPKTGFSPDMLIHLAANVNPQEKNEARMMKVNVRDSIRLFKKAIAGGCERIVYASSAAVYGDGPVPFREQQEPRPLTPYARSKLELDVAAYTLAQTTGVPITGLRFSNVYGRGEAHKGKAASVVWQMVKTVALGKRPKLFRDGEQKRDWLFVKDCAEAVFAVAKSPLGGVVNVGSGTAVSFNEVMYTLNNVVHKKVEPVWIDNPYAATYQSHTEQDISMIRTLYDWKPRFQLEAGIRRMFTDPVD